jgi:tetratricopeptide (TPR) repeat protein
LAPLLDAVKLKPNNSPALATLARVMDLEKHPISETEPYFARALDADSSNCWTKSWYALALSRAGRYPEATQYAQEAIHNSKNAFLLFNYAMVLQASPNSEERRFAVEIAKRAKEFAPFGFKSPALFLRNHSTT